LKQVITLEKVNKYYGIPPSGTQALKEISFSVNEGDFIGIIGKSGAGKSTLINLLAGIDQPTSGIITSLETDFSKFSEDKLAAWRGQNIGVVYQTFQLLNQLSVLDNILLAMDFVGNYRQFTSHKKAIQLLQELEIEDQANKLPTQLSGGQRQRAAIARALANDPKIILADEPTGNLDTITSQRIFDLFSKLVFEGRAVLVVTHDKSKRDIFSRIFEITDGEIINAS